MVLMPPAPKWHPAPGGQALVLRDKVMLCSGFVQSTFSVAMESRVCLQSLHSLKIFGVVSSLQRLELLFLVFS